LTTREKGNISEQKAVDFLETLFFEIVERNFYSRFGEIDIIAKKDNIFHFIEVKSGKNFQSIYNVTPKKLQKIIKTINFYIKKHNITFPYQIDIITIDNGKIEFLENISMF